MLLVLLRKRPPRRRLEKIEFKRLLELEKTMVDAKESNSLWTYARKRDRSISRRKELTTSLTLS